jgi:hypothetical protein
MPRIQMIGQMPGHGAAVLGNQYPTFQLRPAKQFRIFGAKRRNAGVADSNDINCKLAFSIVSGNEVPQRAAKVFVQDEAKRHHLLRCRCGRSHATQSMP